jgi:hypothetical protein
VLDEVRSYFEDRAYISVPGFVTSLDYLGNKVKVYFNKFVVGSCGLLGCMSRLFISIGRCTLTFVAGCNRATGSQFQITVERDAHHLPKLGEIQEDGLE